MCSARPNRGFSLLEILVAFSIAAIALGTIFQIYATGTAAVVRAGEYAHAVAIAQSRIAEVDAIGAAEYAAAGVSQDKYEWTIRVSPWHDGSAVAPDSPLQLREVDVEVRWEGPGRSKSYSLRTLKPVRTGSGAR